jgi:hypothetical protein
MGGAAIGILAVALGITTIVMLRLRTKAMQAARADFIRHYTWPPGLLDKLSGKYPQFRRKESALVSQGLRQFFMAYLRSGRRYVAMPSQVADDLWHEFILYTRDYDAFCKKAFGQFLHHTPAVALAPERRESNAGLRRVWWQCCKEEGINAGNPSRLPLLFALDSKLKIPGGFVYHADCEKLRRSGEASAHCGGDFSSSSVDGSTSGFGDGDGGSTATSDGGSDSGGGCGGGCGGGGD